jgi:hypothetical protein
LSGVLRVLQYEIGNRFVCKGIETYDYDVELIWQQ